MEREKECSETAPKRLPITPNQGVPSLSRVSLLKLQEDVATRGSGSSLTHPWERDRGSSSWSLPAVPGIRGAGDVGGAGWG